MELVPNPNRNFVQLKYVQINSNTGILKFEGLKMKANVFRQSILKSMNLLAIENTNRSHQLFVVVSYW